MKLLNFEEYIDEVIVKRGKKYYNQGRIEKFEEKTNNHFVFRVSGSTDYTVHIFLTKSGDIRETYCNCPFDLGEFCKHQVAALTALRNGKGSKMNKSETPRLIISKKEPDLKSILISLDKEELVNTIINFTEEYSAFEKRLLYKYTPTKDEVTSSKKLIKDYIKAHKRRGFIQWNEVYDALQGAYITLEKAEEKIARYDAVGAVQLSIVVLSIVVEMLQYCDDSNGYAGDVIRGSLKVIHEAVDLHVDGMDEEQKEKLSSILMKEAMRAIYDDFSEWRFDLLRSCIYLSDTVKRKRKLENLLGALVKTVTNDSWNDRYEIQEIKLLQLDLIERFDGKDKGLEFIFSNLGFSDLREKAILHLLEVGDFNKVLEVCEEGKKKDFSYRGLVQKWKKYQLEAYEGLNDVEKQKEIMLGLLYQNEYEYYPKLKQLYSVDEWSGILEDIVKTCKEQGVAASAYVQILVEEKMSDHLLEYCSKNLYSLNELYPYLVHDYPYEVNSLFIKYIETESEHSGDRKKYRKICSLIKLYKKVCGVTNAEVLINDFKEKYKRRPSFIDELNKINLK
jgi:hypothetical protein